MNFFIIFSFLLRSYMYCGSVNLTNLQSCEILDLLSPSNELELQPFVTYIQETLIKNYHNFITNNVIEIIELSKKSLDEL